MIPAIGRAIAALTAFFNAMSTIFVIIQPF
jgi:hypothetical protein